MDKTPKTIKMTDETVPHPNGKEPKMKVSSVKKKVMASKMTSMSGHGKGSDKFAYKMNSHGGKGKIHWLNK